jgi:dephospho-CoA kinase
MSQRLYIIGLTGNIATGKSVVAAMLAELGARVIDADTLAHEVVRADTPAWQSVRDQFGPEVLAPDGEIDRARLGARVFADPSAMARLEAIVHPAVIAESERRLGEWQATATSATGAVQVVVFEAIKLIESGMHRRCDELWVVISPHELQVQRLTEKRGMSVAEAEVRIASQPPQADKVAQADVIIDNSGDLERTRAQVTSEWQRIMEARRPPQAAPAGAERGQGGSMSAVRKWIDAHPFLTMWVILAIGMVAIFLVTSRGVELLPTQRLFMALACVGLAGLCTWIITWE